MNEPEFKEGDRVKVNNLIGLILKVDHLSLSNKYLYLIDFDEVQYRQRIVDESELRNLDE